MLFRRAYRYFYLNTFFIILSINLISGCSSIKTPLSKDKELHVQIIPTSSTPSSTPNEIIHTVTPRFTPINTSSPIPIIAATPTFDQPSGCKKPIEDYDLIEINGMQINKRTYEMLQNAQSLYGGEIDLTGFHLTQGSYNNSVSASFGTHDGGGAVDFSVFRYGTYQVIYEDIGPLIQALRTAGFAAWLRDFDQLYPGSPIHIHAIAIGDRDLSSAAKAQLISDYGYFNGYNGLPPENRDMPVQDEHGGPIICQWMVAGGYTN